MKDIQVPTYDSMMNPLLKAMNDLGGSGIIEEIASRVGEIMELSDEQLEVLHNPDRGGQTEFEYRLAWTRTYLKKYELLENSARGVWALTPKGRTIDRVDEKEIVRFVKGQDRIAREERVEEAEIEDEEGVTTWQDELHETLLQMDPSAFERLVQRMLRESGFVQVEVTGRSGDGGIDGKGIMRLGGLLSFHVFFQCKRYKGTVGSTHIRDFRGAMTGRADKGLVITTGSFSKDAMAEATRDGAPPIDLIDGDQLVELLKNLSLGVNTTLVQKEEVSVDKDWFSGI